MLFLRSRNSVAAISPAAKGMARSSIRPPTMPHVTSVVITPAMALGATSEETDSHSVSNRARSQRRRNDRGCAATVSALVPTGPSNKSVASEERSESFRFPSSGGSLSGRVAESYEDALWGSKNPSEALQPPPDYDRKPSREHIGAVIVPISTRVLSQVTAACPVFP